MMMQAGARHRTRFKSKRPTSQAEKLTLSATVDGFFFPLANDQEVELLEATVRANEKTREQYIQLLRDCKAQCPRLDIGHIFSDLFSDEALLCYNYFGMTNRSKKKRAMRDYLIFSECMLEAWSDEGIDQETLKAKLTKIISRLNHKLRTLNSPKSRLYAYALEKMKQNNRQKYMPPPGVVSSIEIHQESGVTGFEFPLTTEADIERLEEAVTTKRLVRLQYVNFLMQLKQPSDEVDDVLKKIFYDEALGNYNYNGMCNVPNVRKRPMKDYAIFVSCFLEAWADQGVTQEQISAALKKVIKLLNNRKRFRRHKERKRAANNSELVFLEDENV
ncbi:hypothetical protein pipiens_005964 [Culex pipiens pipiens]|uniref:DUF4806 domain-containing protein n=1 Tax=Culex pipiens pipiens TaxID=38569 RepID=A0ABD1DWM2_CULPP